MSRYLQKLFTFKAGLANTRNDGPAFSFIPPDDTVKITMDLSDNGPVFSALDAMMLQGWMLPTVDHVTHCGPCYPPRSPLQFFSLLDY